MEGKGRQKGQQAKTRLGESDRKTKKTWAKYGKESEEAKAYKR